MRSARWETILPVRILVVDDSESFRQHICTMLAKLPNFQVICEVSDGLEAVHKAKQLQPDVILLDVGLPQLNGIAAGRQIRKLSPESKIVFVSQESSVEVVQEALNLGARAYVQKSKIATDLQAAIDSVLEGGTFVSNGLTPDVP
jgi:DNA-binding NarL/FixJ family response regulator